MAMDVTLDESFLCLPGRDINICSTNLDLLPDLEEIIKNDISHPDSNTTLTSSTLNKAGNISTISSSQYTNGVINDYDIPDHFSQQLQQHFHHHQQHITQVPHYSNYHQACTPSHDSFHYQSTNRNLPESPPESSPEPFSPSDGANSHLSIMSDCKHQNPSCSLSDGQPMYLNSHHAMTSHPSNIGHKTVPYFTDAQKLNHAAHSHSQQQQRLHNMQFSPTNGLNQIPHHSSQISSNMGHHHGLPSHLGSMPNLSNSVIGKKRKYSDSPTNCVTSAMVHGLTPTLSIKQEPNGSNFPNYLPDSTGMVGDEFGSYDVEHGRDMLDGTTYQLIKWQPYNQTKWAQLKDHKFNALPPPEYKVEADKGFNYMSPDDAFVCQKKNHFQITVTMQLIGNAKYVYTSEGTKEIDSFFLHFYGIKKESPDQIISIEQSQSDRSKQAFHPEKVIMEADQITKKTVPRLHFSETTGNNMRKKGKPNPDQRYFLLVVALHAHCGNSNYMLVANCSEKIIVRASNPGQFDQDVEILWQKGQNQESVFHSGKVGINTDQPDQALTVHGHIRLTGQITQPSDKRAKESIEEVDSRQQLENVTRMKIYKYFYTQNYATVVGIPEEDREDTGVIAQEVLDILPDAVQETGDMILENGDIIENFLSVNKDRLFTENLGAVQELCKITNDLDHRVKYLEQMEKKIKIQRSDSFKSYTSTTTLSGISICGISNSRASSIRSKYVPVKNSKDSPNKQQKQDNNCDRKASRISGEVNQAFDSDFTSGSSTPSTCTGSVQSVQSNPKTSKLCTKKAIRCVLGLLAFTMLFSIICIITMLVLQQSESKSGSSKPVTSAPSLASAHQINLTTSTTRPPHEESISVPMTSPPSTTATVDVSLSTSLSDEERPVIPAYPPCPRKNYCEKRCCPAPHEDVVIDDDDSKGPPYVIDNNDTGDGEGGWYPDYVDNKQKDKPNAQPIVVNLPSDRSQLKASWSGGSNQAYRVIKQNEDYSVNNYLKHNNGQTIQAVSRQKRGADDAPRPEIRLVELNYNITDVFCREDGCTLHNFTYYIPLDSTFGYSNITLEFRTPTTSYMANCGAEFMWGCREASRSNEIYGSPIQQTNVATWSLAIGTNYRTKLSFHTIHSLKGYNVPLDSSACDLKSGDDFVVFIYNIQFQRTC